jgi:hypothetical protein
MLRAVGFLRQPIPPLDDSNTLGYPGRRFRLDPIQSFAAGFEFVDWFNSAIRPFGFYLPMLALSKHDTKYRNARYHVLSIPDGFNQRCRAEAKSRSLR